MTTAVCRRRWTFPIEILVLFHHRRAMDADGEMSDDEEKAWRQARRDDVVGYLGRQGIRHGPVGKEPAWSLAPYVSVWAVESVKAPGSVGWWVIAGDLPTDYCSARACREPRWAVRTIAESWKATAASVRPWDQTIADSGLPVSLAPILASRAEILLEWTEDPSIWEAVGSKP
jgi:hypothetical protein